MNVVVQVSGVCRQRRELVFRGNPNLRTQHQPECIRTQALSLHHGLHKAGEIPERRLNRTGRRPTGVAGDRVSVRLRSR